MAQITFTEIMDLLKQLGDSHIDIKTCYRWNFIEFDGDVRPDTIFPLMTFEAPTLTPSNTETMPLLLHTTAFNVLGMEDVDTSDVTDEEAQDLVLNNSYLIVLEIVRKLNQICATPFLTNGDKNPWYGLLDKLSISINKVGPVTNSYLYGYRCELALKPTLNLAVDPAKWV